jgi:hypothetical protein
MDASPPDHAGIGHNRAGAAIEIEVKFFNSLAAFAGGRGPRFRLALGEGATVGEVLALLGVPLREVFLAFVNGRDVTPGLLGAALRTGHELENGDVLALSGPVPYSFGYGIPVV